MQQKRNEKLCRELAETVSKLADAELELEEKESLDFKKLFFKLKSKTF